jgi:integrase
LIFPELKKANLSNSKDVHAKIRTATKKFNKHLKTIGGELKIKKKITTHIARHSFGNIAGDKVSPQMLQKLYRHSSITTTMGYQSNFIHTDTDEALESVLDF